MSNEKKSTDKSMGFSWKLIPWTVLISLVLFNLYTGLTIQEIGIPGVFQVKFYPPDNPPPDNPSPDNSPPDNSPPDNSPPDNPVSIDLNATWQGSDGLFYVFTQQGSYFKFEAYNLVGSKLGIGEGQIVGLKGNYNFQLYNGIRGQGVIEVSQDGQHITATGMDYFTGLSGTTVLSKKY